MTNSKEGLQSHGYCITTLGEDGMGTVSSTSGPQHNVTPAVPASRKSQEDQRNAPYRFHSEGFVYDEDSNYHKKAVEEQAKRDARDETRLWVEKVALFVGFFGFVGLLVTLYLTRQQADIAIATLRSQRPYVAPGRKDGTLVEYIPPEPGVEKGAMLVYFQNSGTTPALSFLANVHNDLSRTFKPEVHLQRWRYVDKKGRIVAWPFLPGATIGADSVHIVVVEPKYVPTTNEWEQINAGTFEDGFLLRGNVEYCDQWGMPYCEGFILNYRPPPIGRFVAQTYQCLPEFPYPPNRSDISEAENQRAEILSPCEQPGEREAEREKLKKDKAEREKEKNPNNK